MEPVLIFAGTTEGRRLAEVLSEASIPACVCVATEYGETLLPKGEGITHLTGRMDERKMEELMTGEKFSCVVDATHPYAKVVSENIRAAAKKTGLSIFRLLREDAETELSRDTVFVDSVAEAVAYLKKTKGNILASTGSKELACYTDIDDYQNRVFARVLSTEESVLLSRRLGFEGRNLICMQGPFSEEMNYATMKQYEIAWLVTKASGKAGGYEEKIRAAKRAGARAVIVGRPEEKEGRSFEEVKKLLFETAGIPYLDKQKKRQVYLVSIGTGAASQMTGEAKEAFSHCDAVIGAGRMLEALQAFGKPSFSSYKNEEIVSWIEAHDNYKKIAVAFSGDLGFYSGAKKLRMALSEKEYEILCIPGMSSLIYFAARLGTSWDDAKLMSIHGRSENLIHAVMEYKKVFALLGGKDGVRALCEELLFYGLSEVKVSIGEELSYEGERIRTGTPKELLKESFAPLAVALIENPAAEDHVVTHGMEDEEFIRGKVPMTKYEVRAVSLSRLKLGRNSVVYDIGAGTGSIAIEAARQAGDGCVFAIEKNPEAVLLLHENKRKFAVSNLEIVEGFAPEALAGLPVPSHAFIGGSSGNMKEIAALLLQKNPEVRIVINAIALETVAEAAALMKELPIEDVSVSQVMASRGKKLGNYEMMMGQNPVYIISFTGRKEQV